MARQPLLTRPFVLAFVAHFLFCLAYNLYLHLPGFLKLAGISEAEIGLLVGVTAATAILARPLIGRAMDLGGRRPVILGGNALATVACALFLTVHGGGPWTYVVRVLQGLAEAMLFASLFAFVADIVPASRRIEGIGLFGVSGMLPIALGGLLGDAILARADYRALFLVSALLSGAALVCSLPLVEPRRVADASHAPPRGFAAALAQPDLLPLWLAGLAFALSIAGPFTFLKTYVMERGAGSVGGFFGPYAMAAVLVRVGLGTLPERIGPKRVLFPAFGVLIAGLVLLAAGASGPGMALAGVLCGVGHGYAFPILLGLVVARARSSERGAALSIFTAVFDGGYLVGAPLLGTIIQAAGYPSMFAAAALLLATGASLFGLWDRSARVDPAADPA